MRMFLVPKKKNGFGKETRVQFDLDQETGQIRKKAQKIEPTAYDPSLDVQLKAPFKLWDPRTW